MSWRRCGHMASASRTARLLAWGRLIHPFPVVLKVVACAAFATIAAPGIPTPTQLAALLVGVGLVNAGIGALNDYCDRDLDARSKPSKPLVQGLVQPWQALVVGIAALATGLAATRWLPWPARVSAVVYATTGVAYDLGLKSTRWSWVPFVVAFPLLPIWSWTAVRGWDRRLRWVYPVGAPLVLGIHLANTLPDLTADRRSGVQGLAHRLGPRWSRLVCWGGYLVAQVLVLARTPGATAPATAARAGAVSSAALLASAILIDRRGSRTDQRVALTWHFRLLALAAVPLAVGWILALTGEQR